jgi:hypothetical protein
MITLIKGQISKFSFFLTKHISMRYLKPLPIIFSSIIFLLSACQSKVILEPSSENKIESPFSVTVNEATIVAQEHFNLNIKKDARKTSENGDPFITQKREVKNTRTLRNDREELIHIINFKDNKGFILVSADKRFTPVIAFSGNGEFTDEYLPGVKDWIELSQKYIIDAKKELKEQRPQEKSLWEKYLKSQQVDENAKKLYDECPTCDYVFTRSTGRMTDAIAQYSQNFAYKYYSPNDGGCECGRKTAGCGAVAMAMLMRYYRHPDMNMSFNGESMILNDAGYDAMPRLRPEAGFDCGVPNDNIRRLSMLIRLNGSAANSNYGILGNCSTATIPGNINNALSLMGYSSGGSWDNLSNAHYNTVFSELRQNRPVIFSGTTCITCAGDAHIWVADGLTELYYTYLTFLWDETGSAICRCENGEEKYISMNWGHGGQNNGEYLAFYNYTYFNNHNGYDTYMRALVNIRP